MNRKEIIGWYRENAASLPPCLQSLVVEHGGYDMIGEADWAKFHAEMREWQAMVRHGEHYARKRPALG